MKLLINPKELLALYNLLHSNIDEKQPNSPVTDLVHLRQVYLRLRAIIVAGLNNTNDFDPIESWMKHEQEKINRLTESKQDDSDDLLHKENVAPVGTSGILTDDEGDVESDVAYPSKKRQGNQSTLQRGKKQRLGYR